MNQLEGMPLSYLIGADEGIKGIQGRVFVVPYNHEPTRFGTSVGYCNLFDELNTGRLGPYLHTSDTADEYNEGQIDPQGKGWGVNLSEQFSRRKREGFEYIELDNPDAYDIKDVLNAVSMAGEFGLKVIAKNPGLNPETAVQYLEHPNIYGAICERGSGNPSYMEYARKAAGKLKLPVWFVYFGRSYIAPRYTALRARIYCNMGVTISRKGEYKTVEDLLLPIKV